MVCMNVVERKNIDSVINAVLAHRIYVQVKDMNSSAGYLCSWLLHYHVIIAIIMHYSEK